MPPSRKPPKIPPQPPQGPNPDRIRKARAEKYLAMQRSPFSREQVKKAVACILKIGEPVNQVVTSEAEYLRLLASLDFYATLCDVHDDIFKNQHKPSNN